MSIIWKEKKKVKKLNTFIYLIFAYILNVTGGNFCQNGTSITSLEYVLRFFVHFVMYIRQICNNHQNKMVTYATIALTA